VAALKIAVWPSSRPVQITELKLPRKPPVLAKICTRFTPAA
jgi:hypothetical protein